MPISGYFGSIELRCEPNVFKDYFSTSKEQPMSSSTPTPQGIVNDIRRLPESADISAVKSAVLEAEKERRQRIEKALAGQADLCVMCGAQTKRFVVTYWYHNEVRSLEGLEYPVEYDDSGETKNYGIVLDDGLHPFAGRYDTMDKFREFFKNNGYPCHIAYFDK